VALLGLPSSPITAVTPASGAANTETGGVRHSTAAPEARSSTVWNTGFDARSVARTSGRMAKKNLARTLAKTGGFSNQTRLLDVGFGFADQDLLWVKEFDVGHITGLNITPSQVLEARGRVSRAGLDARIDLREGSATDTKLPDGTVNTVSAMECAFHFITREAFFREAHRVLTPGGRLVLSDICTPLRATLKDRLLYRYGHLQWQVPAENLYDREAYRARLEAAGFVDVRVDSITEHVWPHLFAFLRKRLEGDDIHWMMRTPWTRAVYAASVCWLWPLLEMDYVIVSATRPA
jgi:ubiquinone/menaquinone biosynthesis C-methylase UbiE